MHINQKVKAVAFDLDQTLFSREHAFRALMNSWAGSTLSSHEYAIISAQDHNGYGDRMAFFSWISQHLGLKLSAQETMLRFRSELPHHIQVEHKSIQLIKRLRNQGYQVALLTNGGAELQQAKLERSQIMEHIPDSNIIISANTPFQKPQKEIFQLLCNQINTPPAEVIYVGDHYTNDALGAHHAGLHSIWLQGNQACPSHIPKEIFMIAHLEEIENILEKLG